MKTKKINKKGPLVIDTTTILMNASGKIGRHTPTVQSGTGTHQSKKSYNRKKEKASLRQLDERDAFLVFGG
jgi:hypothetical protein